MPDSGILTVLGFDYGARRIGIALGNRLTESARALEVVANGIPSAPVAITVQGAGTLPGAFAKSAPANGATAQPTTVTLSPGRRIALGTVVVSQGRSPPV